MCARRWWHEDESALLARLARAGVGLSEIALRMAEAGWPARDRRARAAKVRDMGISIAGLVDAGEPLSARDAMFLRRYVEAEKTDEQAASLMARTVAETTELARAMGLALIAGQARRKKAAQAAEPHAGMAYADLSNGERQAKARADLRRVREAQAARIEQARAYRMRDWHERVARGEARI